MVAALGFNTGGLDKSVDTSFNSLNKSGEDSALKKKALSYLGIDSTKEIKPDAISTTSSPSKYFPVLLSASYALFLSLGSIAWFFFLAYILAKYRQRINIKIVNRLIQSLGWALCLFGLFLGYKAITMLL